MEARPSPVPRRIGKYEIVQEIGSGGFGHVYRALDPAFDRVVAVKVLNAPDDPDTVRRFRIEAKTVANLHHKNIVTVHDYGETDGVPYLVMEYLDGTTLQTLIGRNALSLLEKVDIMSEVAEGLEYAHERGVTHRDVKPANIMRLADGSVKIMDFGIARLAVQTSTRLTKTGYVVGSLEYMAPEQFGGTSDALTDVFSYGVTFYELLTGHNPFASPDPAVTIYKITNTDAPAVSLVAPECPKALDRILRGALARSREARYGSLSDVVADTRAILSDLRRDHAGKLYAEAGRFFDAGQFDAAKSAVRKVLDLDPVHTDARRLRSEIEEALRRRDLGARARPLLEKVEKGLLERQYEEAAGILDSVRQLGITDPQLKARLDMAATQIEQAGRRQQLLDAARENLKNQDLTEAFRAASEVLSADPGNAAGRDLFQEIRAQMDLRESRRRFREDLSRAEGLLLIGETQEALSLLAEIERRNPQAAEVSALRARAEDRKAQEDRARRLAEATADVRSLLRNGLFEQAVAKIDSLRTEFADNPDLQTLRRHASERLAAQRRLERIANLKFEAARLIEQHDFDNAIRALEAGIAELGDDGDLTRLVQAALAGKASQERDRAVSRTLEEAERLRLAGKLDDAARLLERAIQVWGNQPPLLGLLHRLSASREAENLLQQGKASASRVILSQAIASYGDDPELRKLLERAESQVRAGERSARLAAILGEVRRLAGAMQWQAALQKLDEGLATFPGEPSLIAERASLIASLDMQQREQATRGLLAQIESLTIAARLDEATQLLEKGVRDLGPDPRLIEARQRLLESLEQRRAVAASLRAGAPVVRRSEEEGHRGAPPPTRHGIVRRPWIRWIAGGVLAVAGILYWALMPHSKPSPPAIETNPHERKTAVLKKDELPPPPADGGAAGGAPGSVSGRAPGGARDGIGGSAPRDTPPPSPVKKEVKPLAPRRIKVEGAAQQAMVISQPRPLYPPLAIQARIEGVVELNAIIGKDGTVQDLTVARGHPFLVQSAVDAVKQWRYRPTLIDGEPVEVQTTIDVNFTLSRP
ncbi:MAG: TonB family protein [Bryobacteraceae bacterium]